LGGAQPSDPDFEQRKNELNKIWTFVQSEIKKHQQRTQKREIGAHRNVNFAIGSTVRLSYPKHMFKPHTISRKWVPYYVGNYEFIRAQELFSLQSQMPRDRKAVQCSCTQI